MKFAFWIARPCPRATPKEPLTGLDHAQHTGPTPYYLLLLPQLLVARHHRGAFSWVMTVKHFPPSKGKPIQRTCFAIGYTKAARTTLTAGLVARGHLNAEGNGRLYPCVSEAKSTLHTRTCDLRHIQSATALIPPGNRVQFRQGLASDSSTLWGAQFDNNLQPSTVME